MMKLIDKDRLQNSLTKKHWEPGSKRFADGFNDCLSRVKSMVHSQPVVDAVPVVRCKDCRYYGVICPFKMIYEILTKLENAGTIDIVRDPALTAAGKKRTFWEEKAGQTVIVRRRT